MPLAEHWQKRAEVAERERDALREKTDNEFHDAAVAYAVQSAALEQLKGERDRAWAALQEESENSAYHLKELRETEAALSQAQQALRWTLRVLKSFHPITDGTKGPCVICQKMGEIEAALPSDAPEATR